MSNRLPSLLVACIAVLVSWSSPRPSLADEGRRPNVLLIVTDDQGYGDFGIHGNTKIQTPHLDALARQSVRLTNFHSDPTCAESRSALMTGRYSCRVGVWHTIMGRSILRSDETILPQFVGRAGYKTGIFGKWHLGDNYPFRPQDRGFQESLVLRGGGVGQSPDAWGNDYFDDTYQHNGQPEKQTGYCTDVFFAAATKFIDQHRDEPFFCYVATNAPHSPYNVDPKYSQPYIEAGVPQPMANFYGMIANIDENVGRLLGKLDEWKLADNTIVLFMTDNGTAAGVAGGGGQGKGKKAKQSASGTWKGFTAGMRAQKGSQYEGGHRVPCFIRWPGGHLPKNQEVSRLTAHFDLLPTLGEWCGFEAAKGYPWDGRSLAPLLTRAGQDTKVDWPARTLIVHSQRVDTPEKWRKSAVMTDRWRLVDGQELYEIARDPGQQHDVAAEHPEVVAELRRAYETWWADVSKRFNEYSRIVLGTDHENPTRLNCHDWHPGSDYIPWSQSGQSGVAGDPWANGLWAVEIAQPGRYEFTLRVRPEGVSQPLAADEARVKIGDAEATVPVPAGAEEVKLTVDLQPGPAMLQTWLVAGDRSRGAYYTTVRHTSPKRQRGN